MGYIFSETIPFNLEIAEDKLYDNNCGFKMYEHRKQI